MPYYYGYGYGYGYYSREYFWFLGAILLCMLFSAIASHKVKSSFEKYDKVRTRTGTTGSTAVRRLFQANGVYGISIGKVAGQLSDHYHPKKAVVNLSESTHDSCSVAAVAVAAHEVGHVMQKKERYWFYNLRTALVPVVNVGTFLAIPLVLLGILMETVIQVSDPDMGFKVAMIGVALYGGSMIFALVTLPVELDASRRAKRMLVQEGILYEDELPGASKVLSAAAMTYLASLVTSMVYFLRFLFYVLQLFGRSRD